MKKLSLLIAIALCVTIGGVYAAWTYAGAGVTITNPAAIGVTLETEVMTDPKGTLTNTGAITATIADDNNDYNAELKLAGDGYTFTYTKDENAPASANEVTFVVTVSVTANKYGEKNILTVGTSTKEYTVTSGNSFTITTAVLTNDFGLALGDTFNLPTPEAHAEFETALAGSQITITVTEKSA